MDDQTVTVISFEMNLPKEFPLYFCPTNPIGYHLHAVQFNSENFTPSQFDQRATLTPLLVDQGKLTNIRIDTSAQSFNANSSGTEDISYGYLRVHV